MFLPADMIRQADSNILPYVNLVAGASLGTVLDNLFMYPVSQHLLLIRANWKSCPHNHSYYFDIRWPHDAFTFALWNIYISYFDII